MTRWLLPAVLLVLVPALCRAHVGGTTYLYLDGEDRRIELTADLDAGTLAADLALDADGDGRLRFAEIDRAAPRIAALALERLQPSAAGTPCTPIAREPLAISDLAEGPAARLVLTLACAGGPLELDYSAGFRADPAHRVLLISADGSAAVLTADAPRWRARESAIRLATRFFTQGAWHLVTGHDHLAFLAVLLIAVLQPASARSRSLGVTLGESARVVTGFTLAHSLTLTLAATGLVRLPGGPVEVVIAASVLFAAVGNLLGWSALQGWRVATGFGLVHGLGFAGALGELLGGAAPLLPLGAFNLGIEFAQVAIAAIAMPIAWALLRWAPAARLGVPAISLAVAVVAAGWVWQRL